jgi:Ubiquitin family
MGIPARDLHLFLNGEDVPDNCHGDILDVATEVEVELANQSKLKLCIHPRMHLANIKDIIFDKTGIPKNEQRIFLLDGKLKELPNSMPLGTLGVDRNSVLQLLSPPEEITIKQPRL